MTLAYSTPGVYYERVDAQAPAIAAIRTDVAGFVGIASRGPVDTPVPVESWRQFEAHFGSFTGVGFLAYAVRGFFENGGRRCWIIRVASKDANGGCRAADTVYASTAPARDVWLVRASSHGVWGNNLTVRMIETHRGQASAEPMGGRTDALVVSAVAGFIRGTQVRVSQPGGASLIRVVSDVDASENLLYFVHPDPSARLVYDAPLDGFDPDHPLLVESVEYTIAVRYRGVPVMVREQLSLIREHPAYGPQVLAPAADFRDLEIRKAIPPPPLPIVIEELRPPDGGLDMLDTGEEVRLKSGADGLTLLSTYDFAGQPAAANDSDEAKAYKSRGIQNLDLIEEIAVVAVPDIHIQPILPPPTAPPPRCIPDPCLPSAASTAEPFTAEESFELPPVFSDRQIFEVQGALVTHCELRRDRIAVLETPKRAAVNPQTGPAEALAWRKLFDSKYAALYYSWLRVVDPLRLLPGSVRDIPPSGHVAGQYARTDFEIGVHAAPANSPLQWVQDVTAGVSFELHGIFNTEGINVLKPSASRGIRIMGARTVSSDPSWRYVNVRRLLMMIEEAIYESLQWAVFDPNDFLTRAKIQMAIDSFLIALWQEGALMGATRQEAFFVKCDEDNNPQSERDNGRLIADVGVAPSKPFEFVVIRVGRTGNEFELSETTARTGER